MAEGRTLDSRVAEALAMRTDAAVLSSALETLAQVLQVDGLSLGGSVEENGEAALAAAAASGVDLRAGGGGKASLRRTLGPRLKERSVDVAMRFLEACAPLEEAVLGLERASARVSQGCAAAQLELARVEREAAGFLAAEGRVSSQVAAVRSRREAVEEAVRDLGLPAKHEAALLVPLNGHALGRAAAAAAAAESGSGRPAAGLPTDPADTAVADAEAFLEAAAALGGLRERCRERMGGPVHTAAVQLDEDLASRQAAAAMAAFEAVKAAAPSMTGGFAANCRAGRALGGLVRSLGRQEALLRACREVVAGARRRAVARAFVKALARGQTAAAAAGAGTGSGSRDSVGLAGAQGGDSLSSSVGDIGLAGVLGQDGRLTVSAGDGAEDGADGAGGAGGPSSVLAVDMDDGAMACGALLAWTHQAVVAEAEGMTALFGADDTAESDGKGLVARIAAGLCGPLRIRLDQIIGRIGLDDPAGVFAAFDLVAFYASLTGRLLGDDTPLPAALRDCAAEAAGKFKEAVAAWGHREADAIPALPAGLSCPMQVHAAATAIARLAELPSGAMSAGAVAGAMAPGLAAPSRASGDGCALPTAGDIVDAAVEPLLAAARQRAGAMRTADGAVWLANVSDAVVSPLRAVDGAQGRVARLVAELSFHMDTVVREEANSALARCGCLALLRVVESHDPASAGQPLSAVAGASASEVALAARGLADVATAVTLGTARQLESPKLRSQARSGVESVLVAAFEALAEAVADPRNGYEGGAGLLPLSAEALRALVA
ncbi:hypothetical protein FNF29_01960 [Cafeteria roenbergensis]|uniref:Conserved Oligomeric Golgi complex subunit 6 C-terminal domain-containing protein n=1 Tax=Cafeteria roenbergensis TaxID=33653 RepID=A0A5A8CSQ4_CAFRO|nr:hypothetical protein FNF29_01960 [Cafeteria roenbergensis]|eukprot:KAA0155210.1 hypothetical protein FNF29_01960 [Cafeteria roenbergensis]